MKMLYSLLLLLTWGTCVAQTSIEADSLNKYSYFIEGFVLPKKIDSTITSVNSVSGTGFFIKSGTNVFLITAKHVLTGCVNSIKPNIYPKSVFIMSSKQEFITTLDISIIKDTAACLPITKDPDVIAVLITNKINTPINFVNDFIQPLFNKVNAIEIFGYPITDIMKLGSIRLIPPSHISLPKKTTEFVNIIDSATKVPIDTINFRVFSEKYVFDSTSKGYSGSPVFVQDLDTKKWRVAGVAVAFGIQVDKKSFLYVTKIDYALKKINEHY